MRKRIIADEPKSSVVPHFDDVMCNSVNIKVDPDSCIPLTKIRDICESGVLRLMRLFDGNMQTDESFTSFGIALGSDMPIVVELTGSLRNYLYLHFKAQGKSDEQIRSEIENRDKWYGIIDGQHCHEAILRLRALNDRWSGFMWFVCLVMGGHELKKYQQLARFQNARHDANFYIEITFYDIIKSLKDIYNGLKSRGLPCTGPAVVTAYTGAPILSKQGRTLVQTANVAVRLHESVIDAIGSVCNAEYADICLSERKYNKSGCNTRKEIMSTIDCRVFRNMINISSLKSSKAFMNAGGEVGKRAQYLTIYKARDLCQQNGFKPLKHDNVTELFEMALAAIQEEEKFIIFLDGHNWPEKMAPILENMLKTTILDEALKENKNSTKLFDPLLSAFKRHFPSLAPQKITKYNLLCNDKGHEKRDKKQTPSSKELANRIATKGDDSNCKSTVNSVVSTVPKKDISPPSSPGTKTNPTIESAANIGNNACGKVDNAKTFGDFTKAQNLLKRTSSDTNNVTKQTDNLPQGGISDESILSDNGIETYNMTWKTFISDIWTNGSTRADFVISEPPHAPNRSFLSTERRIRDGSSELDREELEKFPAFVKRVAKTGAYVLLFIPSYMYEEWYKSFSSSGFSVMDQLYVFSYDPNTVPRRHISLFPQTTMMTDYALLAKAPGDHPAGFTPDFDSRFHLLNCTGTRRSMVLDKIPFVKNKLTYLNTRMPVRMTEKNINLISEMVDLYSPINGSVIDPYGGVLTTPLSCFYMSRRCVVMEADSRCYKEGLRRLNQVMDRIVRSKFKAEVVNVEEKVQQSARNDQNGTIHDGSKNKGVGTISDDKTSCAQIHEQSKEDVNYVIDIPNYMKQDSIQVEKVPIVDESEKNLSCPTDNQSKLNVGATFDHRDCPNDPHSVLGGSSTLAPRSSACSTEAPGRISDKRRNEDELKHPKKPTASTTNEDAMMLIQLSCDNSSTESRTKRPEDQPQTNANLVTEHLLNRGRHKRSRLNLGNHQGPRILRSRRST